MNFFLNILKPPGMTSHDVVAYLRRLLQIKRIGHTGTLDPGVAGVLPIAVGKATKAIEYLDEDKHYRCEALFGMSTTTQDLDGELLSQNTALGISEDDISVALESFTGNITQRPPMFSAIKVKGKKLYEIARQGKKVEVPVRKVAIYSIEIIDMNPGGSYPTVMFDIHCEKGTYVRTICHDLGEKLRCGGVMSFLIRTCSGPFKLANAITLEELTQRQDQIHKYAIPVDSVLNHLPKVTVDQLEQNKLQHGQQIIVDINQGPLVRVLTKEKQLLGIGKYITDETNTYLKMKKTLL